MPTSIFFCLVSSYFNKTIFHFVINVFKPLFIFDTGTILSFSLKGWYHVVPSMKQSFLCNLDFSIPDEFTFFSKMTSSNFWLKKCWLSKQLIKRGIALFKPIWKVRWLWQPFFFRIFSWPKTLLVQVGEKIYLSIILLPPIF